MWYVHECTCILVHECEHNACLHACMSVRGCIHLCDMGMCMLFACVMCAYVCEHG